MARKSDEAIARDRVLARGRSAAWREQHPEHYRRLRKMGNERRRQRIAKVLMVAKLTCGCVDCGYNRDPRALEWDHRDRSLKAIGLSSLRTWAATWREVEKCDVVCANCHAIRTHERGEYDWRGLRRSA